MGIVNYTYNRSTSGGEIITHLINSSDGAGLHFADGASLLLTYAAGGVFGTADFSIEFILDQDSDNSSDNEIYTSQISGSNVLKLANSIGTNVVRISFDSTDYDISYDMSGDYGTPTHYVLTCDRSALATLYKDGNSVGTISISGSSAVNLGNGNTANGYLGGVTGYGVIGSYYRWRTWKKLLSAAEVTACYENASVPIADQWSNCVTDLDLAFSNPERSLAVRSRSGAGDATASAGVFQLSPIEQLNSKAARIGTSAATPADGDLLVSGTVTAAALNGTLGATTPATVAATTGAFSGDVSITNTAASAMLTLNPTTATYSIIQMYGAGAIANGLNITVGNANAYYSASVHNIRSDGGVNYGVFSSTGLAVTGEVTATTVRINGSGGGAYVGVGEAPIGGAMTAIKAYNQGVWAIRIAQASAGSSAFGVSMADNGDLRFARDVNSVADAYTLTIAHATGVITASSGIVETNGVLKSNLLTNSGFDVWSNSTLENVTGSNLVTGWTNGAGGDAYETFTTSSENITSAINSSGNALAYFDISGLTTGKLYEISMTVTLNSGTGPALATASAAQSGAQQTGPQFVAGANSWVWEQGDDDNYIWLKSGADTGAAGDWSAASVTLKEVTPGCVAADALACDGWAKDSLVDIWRQHNDGGTLTHDGSFYALKATFPGGGYEVKYWNSTGAAAGYEDPVWVQRFAGRTVTFGAWVKADNALNLRIVDSDGNTEVAHSGGSGWEWVEVTRACGASITQFSLKFRAAAAETAYFSQPMLVFGSAIGSGNYSRPSGEVVVCEGLVRIQSNVSPLAADDKILNLEALSSGKIPKGCKAIDITGQIQNSAVTTYDGVVWMATSTGQQDVRIYPTVAVLGATFNGLVTCDSNGDIYQLVSEPDATLSGLYQDVLTVHLR
jgi:hypothetical protein